MKREVEESVNVLKELLKPVVDGESSADDINLDLWDELGFSLEKVIFNPETHDITIVTPDRPEKSAVIGKGGWVVGRLREELGANSIHVESYSDMLIKKYRMELALEKLGNIMAEFISEDRIPLQNLQKLLEKRIENIHSLDCTLNDFNPSEIHSDADSVLDEARDHRAVVALSGGVDSSASLVIAKFMGFNPVAVTVNPGEIVLPRYFQKSVENLSESLEVPHEYVTVDMKSVVDDALEGKIHPCGRCSSVIENAVMAYANKIKVQFVIFGDFLSTGSQSILLKDGIWRINMPAMLSATKGETKGLAGRFGIESRAGYGCPLINEVHKMHPHMRRFSIQRVLRETRAGVLEPGEALNLIMRTL
ncbi:7-cyano-7-deazaguanine synthase [Methanobacterium aggregans]|uniref:7-cyano-7-deazaguanine synthase n=1 Tax=Methanobacterium aggregans TaxID=1615586 RepID=UPI001AE8E866|nr:7-cyano-7-deazaguanine synthase [Methanobacterium aggregans]MBP2046568.1 putative PP-loop superfamily ATPase [Methanobacterium aggregans]